MAAQRYLHIRWCNYKFPLYIPESSLERGKVAPAQTLVSTEHGARRGSDGVVCVDQSDPRMPFSYKAIEV